MSQAVNFATTNPAEFPDRLTQLQIAVQQDELAYTAYEKYTAAGAIAVGGNVGLKTGTAGAMTIAAPIAGAQSAGGQDGTVMRIVAYDAEAYTVTGPTNCFNGADHIATFGGAIGDVLGLIADNGIWYVWLKTGVTLS